MELDKSRTACFSGYRVEKFSFSLEDKTSAEYINLCNDIDAAIKNALNLGFGTFLCGMAKGFDLLCAQAVLKIRQEQNNIKLISVLPFKKHSFSGEWGKLHREVRNAADYEFITSPKEYARECYFLRNRFMVENSSYVICYWDGQDGGTAHTIRMAKKHGHTIHNLL